MPKIAYENWSPRPESIALVKTANEIIVEYQAQGLDLTLRQLYYQLVSRDVIPNTVREYKKIGDLISKARRAGLVDWDAIVDRTRSLRSLSTWDGPEEILRAVASQYRTDIWETQPHYVEVWFEKDALVGVFERPANQRRVPFFSCRGYVSDSEAWSAARRLAAFGKKKRCTILHFGDHDPSGIDMTRDIEARLVLFGAPLSLRVKRIALNFPQIEKYNPPPNPAKESDPRFLDYQQTHGDESWELDALNPTVLASLVSEEVALLLDRRAWETAAREEESEKERLKQIAERYQEVSDFLET